MNFTIVLFQPFFSNYLFEFTGANIQNWFQKKKRLKNKKKTLKKTCPNLTNIDQANIFMSIMELIHVTFAT